MSLILKYNQPVPRYTSYPTVPYWQKSPPTAGRWLGAVNERLAETPELSLYIHLPFCERLCTYCGCNKRITRNHAVESPYVSAVLAEWQIYVRAMHRRPRLKELHLGGGTPTFFAPAELARLIDGILEHADVAEEHSFGFEAHPSSTSREHLETLAARGFNRLSIGVQDFSQRILKIINRYQTEEQITQTVATARQLGYASINFDVIYGLPTQGVADVVTTVGKIRQLRPERIAFYGYAHVPWVSPGQRAYDESDLPQGQEKWLLYETGRQHLEEMGYRDIGLDHFALPTDELYQAHEQGTLHRNFMGYTTADSTLTIALGCSAIGDSWDTYVQNEKTVEAYQHSVLVASQLPLIKGHELNLEDRVVRRHILNLMCRGTTSWRQEGMRCSALQRAISLWDDMATDGILVRSPYRIEVTGAGKPFLRNICLPLDDHYWARQPQDATFSKAI
ncbi:MAG: oxygen-independent coproporphyrinogen III oxidase [Bacteroidota bacterium]